MEAPHVLAVAGPPRMNFLPPPSPRTCNGPDGSQGAPSSPVHHYAPAAPYEARHMRGLSSRIAPLEFVASTSHAVELVWWWMWNGPVASGKTRFADQKT